MSKPNDIQKLIEDCGGRKQFWELTGIAVRTTYDYYKGDSQPSQNTFELIRDACKWRLNSES